jgi:hypothetical protein
VLLGERAADAGELGRGVVAQATVGLDLAAERAQQVGEVVRQQRRGEREQRRPLRADTFGREQDGLPPGLDALGMLDDGAQLQGFERGAFYAGAVEQVGDIEDPAEVEAATGDNLLHLGCALLLSVDPTGVGARREREYAGLAQRRLRAAAEVVEEVVPLQRLGAPVGQRGRYIGQQQHGSILCWAVELPRLVQRDRRQ